MTVGELIGKLQEYDPLLEVRIGFDDLENGEIANPATGVEAYHISGRWCDEDAVVIGDYNFSGRNLSAPKGEVRNV